MSSKVACYLRTLRREWGLSQEELASLIPRCRRHRVSRVERGLTAPNAAELLAYTLLFAAAPQKIFPDYVDGIQDAIMRGAGRLDLRLVNDESPSAARKREFLQQLSDRIAPLSAPHNKSS